MGRAQRRPRSGLRSCRTAVRGHRAGVSRRPLSRVRVLTKKPEHELLTVAGCEVAISNPNKVLFPQAAYTKLDVVRYYLAVSPGALRSAGASAHVVVG